MKGRLYDGAIGRFISADPFVQYPLWSQGLNRYSYGFNNPMSGSDPTGYSWDGWGVVAVVGGGLGLIAYGVCVAEAACGTVDWGATSSSSSGADAGGASPVGDVVGGGYAMYDAISGLYESSYTSYPSPALKDHVQFGRLEGAQGPSQGGLQAKRGGQAPGNQTPSFDPGVKAGVEYAINRYLYGPKGGRSAQRAAEAALAFWQVSVNDIFLDSALPRIAETAYYESGAVAITFNPAHFGSARWLLSTAYHEGVIHVQQYRSGGFASYPKTGFWVNELEAISAEQQLAQRLGLSAEEVGQLQTLWNDAYQNIVGTPYQKRVDAGNFQLF